ncbi:hypothetical protein IQ260_15370 [Leptolyngbya cf. ectocarpi LEGE 11479]|uniref:Uncharacterized protein n=1 Tax=Leptolyngbya cf. ectocarpi LEGE 11479 TaxID=1828722 RepID=A0A929F682_LEPEC|nr:hypothetical protein [Leptolyngbya cf. ectocarpi LEGE 11479]
MTYLRMTVITVSDSFIWQSERHECRGYHNRCRIFHESGIYPMVRRPLVIKRCVMRERKSLGDNVWGYFQKPFAVST